MSDYVPGVEEKVDIQFVVASGPSEVQRAVFAFAAALAASEMGSKVVVALTMLGAHWASDSVGSDNPVPGFPSIQEMMEMIREGGGRIEACSSCIENYCPAPKGEDGKRILANNITRVGLGLIASRMSNVQTIMC